MLDIYEKLNSIDDTKSLNEGLFDNFGLRKKFPPEAKHAQIVQVETVAPQGKRRVYYLFGDASTGVYFGPEAKSKAELKAWLEYATPKEIRDTMVKYTKSTKNADFDDEDFWAAAEEADRVMMK